jgi:hypothetical protein
VRFNRLSAMASPESIASMLVALLAVVVLASQVVAAPVSGPVHTASPAPSVSASPAPTASVSASSPLGPLIVSSLQTMLIIDGRLAKASDDLVKAVALKSPVAENIATILRGINSDMAAGTEAANRLLAEPRTAALGGALVAFYAKVAAQNAETLGKSITVVSAYVDGGRKVVRILAGLGALDKRIQSALDGTAVGSPEPSASPSTP